ncbi:glycosyltransferase family 2 protein [Xylanibacter oryzae]|uniref:glycosyltransferase family 2 protein n=1 Tax=Xylanibacter oryzae TaxID=185293 RepID=UPI0004ADF82F|nr:glycosyltransferase [Xylanibacter oryzae]
MNTTPKLSIIVPIFNLEKYLICCIKSILNQTFTDYELILINDGSTDASGEICNEYAKNDCRVKVIHQKNSGVGCARQKGLDNAIGEYITYVDPDDWIESNAYEEMVKKAEQENSDMLFCDFYREHGNKTTYESQKPSKEGNVNILLDMFYFRLAASCWNRIIRRDIIQAYGVTFKEGLNHWEDLYFIGALLKENIKVSHFPKAFYHYNLCNESSLTKTKPGRYEIYLDSIPVFQNRFLDIIPRKRIKNFFLKQALPQAFGAGDFEFKSCREKFKKYTIVILFNASLRHNLRYFLSTLGFYNEVCKYRKSKHNLINKIKKVIK